jgi:hypothetical protein
MPNVAILSRDASHYHALLKRAALPELNLLWVAHKVNPQQDYAQVDILYQSVLISTHWEYVQRFLSKMSI